MLMRGIVLGKKEKRLDRHCLLKAGSSVLRMRAVRCQARTGKLRCDR